MAVKEGEVDVVHVHGLGGGDGGAEAGDELACCFVLVGFGGLGEIVVVSGSLPLQCVCDANPYHNHTCLLT